MRHGVNTAIYCRLSKEDGNEESSSIHTQKEVLIKYVQEQGWNIVDVYADDGYSGTNYDLRPEFQRMISDIEYGRINIVITKDLSRLGRNYIKTGELIDDYFPEKNIRYIALNDNYDSLKDDNDFIPFKNIINEWYAKDISKKIKFSFDNMAKKGVDRKSSAPVYGYMYNEDNIRVIDPQTAPNVKIIFETYLKYKSIAKVADELKRLKIKTPRYYNAITYGYDKDEYLKNSEERFLRWTQSQLCYMLKNTAYLGTLTTAKTKKLSFKSQKVRPNLNPFTFENKFEPIIDKETFEAVQKILKRTRGSKVPIEENPFKGLLFCEKCGKLLRFERRSNPDKTKETKYRYYCNNKDCNHTANIQREHIVAIMIDEILRLKEIILSKKEGFIDFIKHNIKNPKDNSHIYINQIQKHSKRIKEIDVYIEKLFETYADNLVPKLTFEKMLAKYNKEKNELDNAVNDLTNNLNKQRNQIDIESELEYFLDSLENITCDNKIDEEYFTRIIDSIFVESERKPGSNKGTYKIRIKYNKLDDLIKEFANNENSNICKAIS